MTTEWTPFNRASKPQRCPRCGWRGVWDQCPVHPRQGYRTCPRCGEIPEDVPAPAPEGGDAMSKLREMLLLLDEDDFDAIQAEITLRQVRSRRIDPTGPTILPEGDSNLAGAILAECCRDLIDYRDMLEERRRR